MQIQDVVNSKGAEVVTLPPETSVRELLALLADKDIGSVVVSTAEQPVAGIVSERDVVRALAGGADALESSVADIMTADVATAGLTDSITDVARLMTDRRIRHVPVLADGALAGLVSIGDIVKFRIDELTFERDQLESYVSNP